MNSRALRRLAADHGALHSQDLPPNYLFPPSNTSDSDDLTELNVLLAGPTHTPFAAGVFKLHLNIPTNYPQAPPTAYFRTPIFHPNVDPQTGGVCVETLKRDWDAKLTLRDILIVIGCLLIQPNPDSALNAEAGALIQNDYEAYTRRAELLTGIHAVVPRGLHDAVREAQCRGQVAEERAEVERQVDVEVKDFATTGSSTPAPPQRRRLGMTARQRGTAAASRKGRPDGSPSDSSVVHGKRRQQNQSFVLPSSNDDVFGDASIPVRSFRDETTKLNDLNDYDSSMSMTDADQENDETRSPTKEIRTPRATATTPVRRAHGPPVPLGELVMDDAPLSLSSSDSSDVELEYPPSPSKSPMKSPQKKRALRYHEYEEETVSQVQAESSRDALSRASDRTPPNLFQNPLAQQHQLQSSSFVAPDTDNTLPLVDETPSPRKQRQPLQQPFSTPLGEKPPTKFGALFAPRTPKETAINRQPSGGDGGGVFKSKSPTSSEKKKLEHQKRAELDAKLWRLCGGDVGRWNRGEFDGNPFKVKAGRW